MEEQQALRRNRQGRSSTREENMELQRKRILGAALHQFAQTGYIGTKISDIAMEAGVSHGLVHHYFDSKLRLYSTILEAGLEYLTETRKRAFAAADEPADKLRRWVHAMIHCFDHADAVMFGNLVMQVLGAPSIHPPACVELLNRYTIGEVEELSQIILRSGKSADEAFNLSWLAFNTLLGNKLIGRLTPDKFGELYRTCCRLLDISDVPVPAPIEYPVFPWEIADRKIDSTCAT